MALGNAVPLVMLATLPFHMVKGGRDDASIYHGPKQPEDREECRACDDVTKKVFFSKTGKTEIINDCNVLWPLVDDKNIEHESPLLKQCNDARKMNFGLCGSKTVKECCARTCCNLEKTDGSSCPKKELGTVFKHDTKASPVKTPREIVREIADECAVCKDDEIHVIWEVRKSGNKKEINDCDVLRPIQENGKRIESFFKDYCIGNKSMGLGSCGDKSTKECCARTCCDIRMTNSTTCVKKTETWKPSKSSSYICDYSLFLQLLLLMCSMPAWTCEEILECHDFNQNSPAKATNSMPSNEGDTATATKVCELRFSI
eukprot:CAMPEP_0172670914 /NCGR_PEP_ID=MMETSP1074-20121228/10581_1 /TAXON_ID=2916 /ORGANISM="Ceratium fusus, Strain PA161109" /LENGTH=315 /DNA_ID=CAMNT_0013487879 /DNA_START=113 /DNA_END=1060 /DNA_ORIENTATION=+